MAPKAMNEEQDVLEKQGIEFEVYRQNLIKSVNGIACGGQTYSLS